MATRPTVMAPPRSTPVRPAVFLQVYGARPGLSRSLALGAPVFLTETRWSCLRNSKTQEKAWSGRKAPRSYAAVMRAGFDELDADGGASHASPRALSRQPWRQTEKKGKGLLWFFSRPGSCSHVVKKEQPKVTVSEIGICNPPTIERMLNWV